jgi:hypothetical protein
VRSRLPLRITCKISVSVNSPAEGPDAAGYLKSLVLGNLPSARRLYRGEALSARDNSCVVSVTPTLMFCLRQQTQLLHHSQVVAHTIVIDDLAVADFPPVSGLHFKVLVSWRNIDQQTAIDRKLSDAQVSSALLLD